MSRVLLFADFGKGPRVVNCVVYREARPGMLHTAGCWLSHKAVSAADSARAWWLVECENAEAGRKAIACNGTTACSGPGQFGCDAERDCPNGRIIASGKGGAS